MLLKGLLKSYWPAVGVGQASAWLVSQMLFSWEQPWHMAGGLPGAGAGDCQDSIASGGNAHLKEIQFLLFSVYLKA